MKRIDRRRATYKVYKRTLVALTEEFTDRGQVLSASQQLLVTQVAEAAALRQMAFREILATAGGTATKLDAENLALWDEKSVQCRLLVAALNAVVPLPTAQYSAGFTNWFAEAMEHSIEQRDLVPAPTDSTMR